MIDLNGAKERLFEASRVRVPVFDQDESPGNKIAKLEDFALKAARWRASLEEARLWLSEAHHELTVQWAMIEGWEVHAPGGKKRKDMTKDDITEAKRLTSPGLWRDISDTKHVIAQLSNQIRRLEKDEDRVSRIYTFITGN